MSRPVRNIAIIAHVDHGKTTLVDKLLQQTGTFASHERVVERVMDSNDLERERGITILAKNCAIDYKGVRINIVDTPGHRDFGGEVERVLGMVDGVLLLVDAVEGPMPQTRFVTRKALAHGLAPIVVINKVDRENARPEWVINRTFDLFDKLGADEHQLDFPVVYASALEGWAAVDSPTPTDNMTALLDTILERVPAPPEEATQGTLQLQVAALDYSSYVGRIAVGRIQRGRIRAGTDVCVMLGDKLLQKSRVSLVYAMRGLERTAVDEAAAGDIVLVTGLEGIEIGATEEQLDFPVVYASALEGWASLAVGERGTDMKPLFDTVLQHVTAPPESDVEGTLQLQVAALDYSSYVGRIGVGRITRGKLRPATEISVMHGPDSVPRSEKINQVLGFRGIERVPMQEARAGDIVLFTGIDELAIGDTLCDAENPEGLPPLAVDEPTLTMMFQVNTSPLAGTEGKFVTSRQVRDRLHRELHTNVALRVEDTPDADVFLVSGRGELHLTILIENMRREGYEFAVGRPRVIQKVVDGEVCEPYESLTLDVEQDHQGAVMESLGWRRGDLQDMVPDGRGRVRLEYRIPARGLIGFQNEFLNATRGTGIASHLFDSYGPWKGDIQGRTNGVLVSQERGEAVAYALWYLQERGRLFVSPNDKLYEGMVIGIHSRDSDLVVNPIREKKLTNVRASGKDENVTLIPPVRVTLEYAVEFIEDDELVEVTPKSIRIRKRLLQAHERKRASRGVEKAA